MPIAEEWLRFVPQPRALGPGEQWNLFLSYRSVRWPWLLNLYDVLQELGQKVFLDQMVPVSDGPPVAANAMGASQAAALIWSPETDTASVSRERAALERMAGERGNFTFKVVQVGEGELSAFPQNRTFRGFATYPDGPAGGELLRFLHAVAGVVLSPEAEQFAQDQDRAAKQGTDEVREAIKADKPDRLVQLSAQDGLAWKTSTVLGGRAAQGLIDLGRNREAIGVLAALEQQFPKAVRPRQLRALALARRAEHSGETTDLEAAREILAGLYETGQRDPETVGIYARLWMDTYRRTGERDDLQRSRDLYAAAFAAAPDDYYTGINAAAKSVFLGTSEDLQKAISFANQVIKAVGTTPTRGDYWKTATAAEAQLILGNWTNAAQLYDSAVSMSPNEVASHRSTWTQAQRLLARLGAKAEQREMMALAFPHLADFRDNLFKTAVAPSLIDQIRNSAGPDRILPVIIDVSSEFPGGVVAARWLLVENYYMNHFPRGRKISPSAPPVSVRADLLQHWSTGRFQTADEMDVAKSLFTETYLFADLRVSTILNLVRDMGETDPDGATVPHPIHKIWEDHEIQTFVYRSAQTIKCDASRIAFGTSGQDILWAVGDTGIDGAHPHFKLYNNLQKLPGSVQHYDFTRPYDDPDASSAAALTDPTGHGTHVAGIIAGRTVVGDGPNEVKEIVIKRTERRSFDDTPAVPVEDKSLTEISGLAPQCKLLSLKVIEKAAPGATSNNVRNLIAAIGYIQQINGYGRDVKIHGLNLSVGYPFDPAWFAVGQSLLCVEVDRLVRCGVVVVVAAGNAGYGRVTTSIGTAESAALGCTIADPGNARLAITVGSTHRDQPHVYGVSYYSSKGPTADGRMKPDLVAPGERIVSCRAGATGQLQADPKDVQAPFMEDSGTSMAAPHVSGAIAGFLSVRREFRGRPEEVKDIFTGAATDLRRRPEFQGAGLIDMMRALQSV